MALRFSLNAALLCESLVRQPWHRSRATRANKVYLWRLRAVPPLIRAPQNTTPGGGAGRGRRIRSRALAPARPVPPCSVPLGPPVLAAPSQTDASLRETRRRLANATRAALQREPLSEPVSDSASSPPISSSCRGCERSEPRSESESMSPSLPLSDWFDAAVDVPPLLGAGLWQRVTGSGGQLQQGL